MCPEGKGRQQGKNDLRRMLDADKLREPKRREKSQSQEGLQR